jgi:cytochrome P450
MPERPIVEFDHHREDFHEERVARWAELRACPVAFNPAFGGFWAVSAYTEVSDVMRDGEVYSSRHARHADDGIDYLGIAGVPRPRSTPTLGIAEVEGDVHVALRRALNPFLVPNAIIAMEPRMQRIATWCMDRHIESGAMDLVNDLTSPVPAMLTMDLVGLPLDSWRQYADLFHGATAFAPGSPEHTRALANIPIVMDEFRHEVRRRRAQPQDDLLTTIIGIRLDDGRALDDDEVVSVVWNLIGGGVDTTSSLTSLALLHLHEHQEVRGRLIANPELLPSAIEEFLRYFPVNESLSRTVTRDVELGDQRIARGDHLLMSLLSANRDDAVFESPDEMLLDRAPNPHLTFGAGPHRCIGMHMARTMIRVLLSQVLARIPEYAVDRDATRFYTCNPSLNGIVRMPVTFTPGPLVGTGTSLVEEHG